MNLVADAMEPWLRASGINFTRNDPSTSAAAAIRESNSGNYDLHLALHSNAAGEGESGTLRGIDIYYYPTSRRGQDMAQLLVENLRTIYPLPQRVRALGTTAIGEVRRTRAPSVLAELGYHDNREDAVWIEENIEAIARECARSVAEFFGLPFLTPQPPRDGIVTTSGKDLNLRAYPDISSQIQLLIPNGTSIRIYGETNGWYSAAYNGISGFVSTAYVRL